MTENEGTLAALGLENVTVAEAVVQDVSSSEIVEHSFDKSVLRFRDQLSESERAAVVSAAPGIATKMTDDFNYIITFGSDVLDEVNSINSRLLNEQKDVEIPEADAIVNNVLREIDGYSAKYGKPDPKVKGFFDKLFDKGRDSAYTLKSMARDAKPIADKLDLAQKDIYKMELKLRDNVNRGYELREVTIKTLDDIVKVLAIFEEVIEVTQDRAVQMGQILDAAAVDGDYAAVEWDGDTYTVAEFREVTAQFVVGLGEIEKTWFNWRQKLFLYGTNVVATRNIITSSFGLQRTCMRVRHDAIPAARSQLVVWQQAEQARQGAQMAEKVNAGVNKLIADAATGTASTVAEVAVANQRAMLSEDTILAVTASLTDQFTSMIAAEREGRAIRARNLAIIQQSEAALSIASDTARQEMIQSALETVRADAKVIGAKSTNDVKESFRQ